jgi:hypothetical protein
MLSVNLRPKPWSAASLARPWRAELMVRQMRYGLGSLCHSREGRKPYRAQIAMRTCRADSRCSPRPRKRGSAPPSCPAISYPSAIGCARIARLIAWNHRLPHFFHQGQKVDMTRAVFTRIGRYLSSYLSVLQIRGGSTLPREIGNT